jgi:RHS repeat-associated protein
LPIDELLARTDSGGSTAWYLQDKLRTIRDIVNSPGSSLYNAVYDSFGKASSETGAGGDRFKFTGWEYDAETAKYYFRARYYDPAAGRFSELDPLGFEAYDTNLFRYVGNSPTTFTDPTGMVVPSLIRVGAVTRAVAGGISAGRSSHGDWIAITGRVVGGALNGGLTVFLWGTMSAPVAGATGGAVGGAVSSAATQLLGMWWRAGEWVTGSFVISIGASSAGGFLGGFFARHTDVSSFGMATIANDHRILRDVFISTSIAGVFDGLVSTGGSAVRSIVNAVVSDSPSRSNVDSSYMTESPGGSTGDSHVDWWYYRPHDVTPELIRPAISVAGTSMEWVDDHLPNFIHSA